MTEKAEPKSKRIYEGEQLERRLAYQREYNQKKRDAEKAAKHRPLKPIEIANAKKPMPVSNVPTEGSKEEMRQFGQKWLTKTTDVKAYRAMLEAEKDAAGKDWNESGKAFFWGLQEGES